MELYAGLDLHLRIPLSESWVMHLLRSNYLDNHLKGTSPSQMTQRFVIKG